MKRRFFPTSRRAAFGLMLVSSMANAAVPPLPPLPDMLPTDQFAPNPLYAEPAPSAATPPDDDNAWTTPPSIAPTPVAVAAPTEAEPALEGSPVPLPPVQRLSRSPVSTTLPDGDGKPISMNLKNADLSAVVQSFAKFSGLNIVASEKIHGLVSLNLVDVPWRRAFDTLLEVHGLAMERHGEVIWVAPAAELAARERL